MSVAIRIYYGREAYGTQVAIDDDAWGFSPTRLLLPASGRDWQSGPYYTLSSGLATL